MREEDKSLRRVIGGGRNGGVIRRRQWLLIDSTGETQMVEAGKHTVMRRTGLPARDLRILDPILSYPSTVLGRERAIVINLEHIKAIITAHDVLLLNSKDPSVIPFVQELQRRIHLHHATQEGTAKESHEKDSLQFEFIALETCLEAACTSLDKEATTLEEEAHPALDKLTTKISTLNLERVRQIKSRLVAITGRVQKVRDELEQLLDDDEDMSEMYLTDKLENGYEQVDESEGSEQDGPNRGTRTTGTNKHHDDVEELEMLLEAYFVQIDGTLNKLSTLRDYVDDTEDYINIMLDDKQNHLLQMGVMLSTATLIVGGLVVMAGVFGMNIHIKLFNGDTPTDQETGMRRFLFTVGSGTTGGIFLYVIAITWYKNKWLLK